MSQMDFRGWRIASLSQPMRIRLVASSAFMAEDRVTLLAREQKCLMCAGRGVDRKATNGNYCDDCWRRYLKTSLIRRAKVGKRGVKADIDWDAVQRERNSGVSGLVLAEKYGVSDVTIYNNTHGAANGKRAARGGGEQNCSVRRSA